MDKIFKLFHQERESKLRAILENVPFGIWFGDENQRCILQSHASDQMIGNMLGKTPDEIGLSSSVMTGWLQRTNGEIAYNEGSWEVNGKMRDFMTMLAPVRY